jgi:hypothetical protein
MTLLIISGCNALPQAPTLTPTRSISAPTLAASPTVRIQSSGALYGDNIRSGQNDLTAAALPNDAAMPPLQATRDAASAAGNSNAPDIAQITLETGDVLIAELYTGSTESGERVPGVLMLGHERFNPGELPADIARAGFTVMVVELPTLTRVETLDTLLSSFSEQGSVDPGLIAVIGAEASADYALLGCAEYLICDAVVLLSPRGRDTLANVLPGINPRPIFVAAAPDDPEGYEAAEALSNGFAEQSRFFEATTGRGTTMLALNSGLGDEIITWLQTVLVGN